MKHCSQCNKFFSDDLELCPSDNSLLMFFDLMNLIGKTIDNKYKIESVLGKGGMGAVFGARHTFIGNEVAIKIIHPEMTVDRSISERFLQEARAATTIDHPNAIRVTDFGRVGDMLYLVMEFIKGESMKEYLHKKHTLSINQTADILSQVCAALDVAHKHKIIHRDLKPDNIMLKRGEEKEYIVKVVDFGIAKINIADSQESITNAGTIIGTANYMSPEQCQCMAIDHRSDIYSLGIIVYEALCGECPFTSPIPMQLIVKHITEPPPPLRSKNPTIPESIERIVMKAIEKQPSERYTSAGEFAQALLIASQSLSEVTANGSTFSKQNQVVELENMVTQLVATKQNEVVGLEDKATQLVTVKPSVSIADKTIISPIVTPNSIQTAISPITPTSNETMVAPITAPNETIVAPIRPTNKPQAGNIEDYYKSKQDLANISEALPSEVVKDAVLLNSQTISDNILQNQITATTNQLPPKRTYSVFIAVALLIIAVSGITGYLFTNKASTEKEPTPNVVTGKEPMPKAVVPENTPNVVATENVVSYWGLLQHYEKNKPKGEPIKLTSVAGEAYFNSDDGIKFFLKSPKNGYVYLLTEELSKENSLQYAILFPSIGASTNSSQISGNQEITTSEMVFEGKAGVEKVWIIWSANQIKEIEEAFTKWGNETDLGVIKDPSYTSVIKNLIDSSASKKVKAEKDDVKDYINLKSSEDVIAYLLKLKHLE